jgi:hypothetical protein
MSPALIQSTVGDVENFEVVVQQGEQLCHWYRDNDNPALEWRSGRCFAQGATSAPALIQSSFGDIGNFEVVVQQGEQLCHWYRDNDDPALEWRSGRCFGSAWAVSLDNPK